MIALGNHVCTYYAQIAQLVEQRTENPRVAGSTPSLSTRPYGLSQWETPKNPCA